MLGTLFSIIALDTNKLAMSAASNSSIASSRAEAISRTVSISAGSSNVNGNQIALLTALSAEPALWFNTTAAYTEIDPPGEALWSETHLQCVCVGINYSLHCLWPA